ncbi:retrotransposon protein, putative, ty1-copia subclass [Tanacetum coccineum]
MLAELRKMFEKPPAVEIYDLVDTLHSCKQAPGKSVSEHVLEMKGLMDQLHTLGKPYDNDMAVNLINRSLNKDFGDFVRNFNMHCVGKTVSDLHALLIDYEKGLKDKVIPTPQVFSIQKGRDNKSKPQGNKQKKGKGKADKNKQVVPSQPKPNPKKRKENPNKDQACHHCHMTGHWKRNCPLYLEEDLMLKGTALLGSIFHMGNGAQAVVEAIGTFDLVLPSGLVLKLNNCYFAPSIVRGVVSFSCLLDLGFKHTVASNGISVSLNGVFYFSAISVNGVFEIDMIKCHQEYNSVFFLASIRREKFRLGSSIFALKIKALRSDRGGEYLSQEFKDYLSENGIVQNLTSPYTPQQNGVSERRNQSAVRILNMVPTKKVDKTPYEIWHGKVPNMSYLKVWGCEAYVKRDSLIKLKQRSVKCIFVGYPKETMGYYFYFPPENKVIVARSERPKNAPNRLCLNMEVEDDEVGDLGEPANYRAAMIDPDKVLWQGAMDEEMKSMKKKTDMDGKVHTYKARLVAKGCTQTYGIDYEETFSPVADIRAIRILIRPLLHTMIMRLCKWMFKTASLEWAIYGLKQASRQWNKRFDEEIKRFGFIQNRDEPCVYRKASGSDVVHKARCGVAQTSGQSGITEYGKLHWVAVKHILKYLRNTKDMFLVYGGNPDTELDVTGFCDASWQCDKDDTKSQTGYVFVVNGGAVDWKSKKQTTIAMHATHLSTLAGQKLHGCSLV